MDGDDDWRLTYFSNEFNTVLVPASYWQAGEKIETEIWLEAVHEAFQFFVECHVDMLDFISMAELAADLKKLQPQLSALVFLDETQQMPVSVKKQFYSLADSLALDVFGLGDEAGPVAGVSRQCLWREGSACSSGFAVIENDLSDLRLARKIVEDFVSHSKQGAETIIVDHPQLQASNLSKFRSMLEIMGY